jgi:hypothetical protein
LKYRFSSRRRRSSCSCGPSSASVISLISSMVSD